MKPHTDGDKIYVAGNEAIKKKFSKQITKLNLYLELDQ